MDETIYALTLTTKYHVTLNRDQLLASDRQAIILVAVEISKPNDHLVKIQALSC